MNRLCVRLSIWACLLLLPSMAAAQLRVEPSRPRSGDTVVVTLPERPDTGTQTLVTTRFPGSRVETTAELTGQVDGQGVRWEVVVDEPGLFRLQAGTESTTIMVGYATSPPSGWFILLLALVSLGGLTAWGMLGASPMDGVADPPDTDPA
jgi:hypothetical protein